MEMEIIKLIDALAAELKTKEVPMMKLFPLLHDRGYDLVACYALLRRLQSSGALRFSHNQPTRWGAAKNPQTVSLI